MKNTFRWNRIALLALIPIFLCVVVGAFGPGLARGFRQNLWKDDPIRAAAVAHSLSNYALPAGYVEKLSMQMEGVSSVIIAPADDKSGMTLLFTQESDSLNDQELMTAMEDAWAKEVGGHTYQTERTSVETMTINGQDATLSYRAGKDETGLPVRQLVTVFYGKTGWTVLVIVSPAADWNQNLVDAFLRSLNE